MDYEDDQSCGIKFADNKAVELFSSMLEKFFYLNMILFNLFNATVQFDGGIQCQSSFKYKLI